MGVWNISPSDDVINNNDGTFILPENIGVTNKVYNITYTDDNGCVSTAEHTVLSGESCYACKYTVYCNVDGATVYFYKNPMLTELVAYAVVINGAAIVNVMNYHGPLYPSVGKKDYYFPRVKGVVSCGGSMTINGIALEYVKIGNVKWSTFNLGATGVTDIGYYFQWADISGYSISQVTGSSEPHKDFSSRDYKYYDVSTSSVTKYNTIDGKGIIEDMDDASSKIWGGVEWKIPGVDDFNDLFTNSVSAWTDTYLDSGIAGVIFTDRVDSSKSIFFPAIGYCTGSSLINFSTNFCYWCNHLDTMTSQHDVYYFHWGKALRGDRSTNGISRMLRYFGLPIRPVRTD